LKKILYSQKQLTQADGATTPFNLEYYILENQTNNEKMNISIYGIEIFKTQNSNGIEYTESKSIYEICSTEKLIHKIAKVLSDNTVTPICLEEVLDELIISIEKNEDSIFDGFLRDSRQTMQVG
jgi:hypothetical protein